MADEVGEGAASADELVAAATSAVEAVLAEQRGAIVAWNQEVRGQCVAGGNCRNCDAIRWAAVKSVTDE